MTRDRTQINNLLYEFKSIGFIQSAKVTTTCQRINIKIAGANKFNIASKTPGSTKYTTTAFFGVSHFDYLYDSENPIKFIQFLYRQFHATNPTPTTGLRKAFTQLLSSNYLIKKDYYDHLRFRQS